MRYKLLLIFALLVLVPHARAQTACIVTAPGVQGQSCIYTGATAVGSSPAWLYASTYTGADQCAKIATAISAAATAGGGTVYGDFVAGSYTCAAGFTIPPGVNVIMNPGIYTLGGTIIVNQEARLLGSGAGGATAPDIGTVLKAATNLNAPVVYLQNSAGATGNNYWHFGELGFVFIEGNASNQSAATSCLQLYQPGEAGAIHNIEIHNCGSWGFEINGGMSGSTDIRSISIFRGTAGGGIFFNGTSSSMVLTDIHTGGNVGPALECKATTGGTTLKINGFQIEGLSVANAAVQAIVFDNTTATCEITGGEFSASSITSGTDFFYRQNGSSTLVPSVNVENLVLGSSSMFTNIYHDGVNTYTLPLAAVSPSSGRVNNLHINNNSAVWLGLSMPAATLTLANGENDNVHLMANGQANPAYNEGYSPSHMLVSGPTAAYSITGFTGFANAATGAMSGQVVFIENATTYAMTLSNQNAGSTSGNQIVTGTGRDYVVQAGASALLMYNYGTTAWDLINLSVPPTTYWVGDWSGNTAVAPSTGVDSITGRAFTVKTPTPAFSNIYAIVNTQDATGTNLYSLAIADSTGHAICHPTTGVNLNAANGVPVTYPCSEGTVAGLQPGNVYILLSTGHATVGKLQGTASSSFLSQYYSTSVAGCTSSAGVISFATPCTISLSTPSVVGGMPNIMLY